MRRKRFIARLLELAGAALKVILGSLAMSIVLYIALSFFVSTPEERALQKQNRLYARLYPDFVKREKMLREAGEDLSGRDNALYRMLFDTDAPDLASAALPVGSGDDRDLMERAAAVDADFREIFSLVMQKRDSLPPLESPLRNFSPAQIGASLGIKMNPVYHASLEHQGLDMLSPNGERVYAAAKGTVVSVDRSRTGLGNSVEIDHGGGYRTRYYLLSDISVHSGQKVTAQTAIGRVGISRSGLFAPHLHYEVLRDGVRLDPVDHLFASVGAEDWAEMVYMAANNVQSMD